MLAEPEYSHTHMLDLAWGARSLSLHTRTHTHTHTNTHTLLSFHPSFPFQSCPKFTWAKTTQNKNRNAFWGRGTGPLSITSRMLAGTWEPPGKSVVMGRVCFSVGAPGGQGAGTNPGNRVPGTWTHPSAGTGRLVSLDLQIPKE